MPGCGWQPRPVRASVGDVVSLKSGGPLMTVIGEAGMFGVTLLVAGFDALGTPFTFETRREALTVRPQT